MLNLTAKEIANCQTDLLCFTETTFKALHGEDFKLNWHHELICEKLEKVYLGQTQNIMFNLPPRYSKTELSVVNFIAWTMGIDPDSEFIFVSYAANLAKENSSKTRSLVNSDIYHQIFPDIKLRDDSTAKDHWKTSHGGVVYAAGSDGQILGFGAGKMREGYGGAIVFDDPHNLGDIRYPTKRNNVIDTFGKIVDSRRNNPSRTPAILTMQRLHEEDVCGTILSGERGKDWELVKIPVLDKNDKPLWPYKHSYDKLMQMKREDPYTFASQYMQEPSPLEGSVFQEDWWQYYVKEPDFEFCFMTADTAQKKAEHNDWSVVQLWGYRIEEGIDFTTGIKTKLPHLYLIDQIRNKWEAPELLKNIIKFWNKWEPVYGGKLRGLWVEDASSGIGVIQILKDGNFGIRVEPIKIKGDKLERASGVTSKIAAGQVHLPDPDALPNKFLTDYIAEFSHFTRDLKQSHDDQVDATVYAIHLTLVEKKRSKRRVF